MQDPKKQAAEKIAGESALESESETGQAQGSVPAGGAGADSGAVESVEIDPDDQAPIQNVSTMNDIPGVGTRDANGGMERGDGDKR
jgi:hypothetical protein